jgi:calcineurin-like phosphoesterase family protein
MNRILKFPWDTRHKHFFTSDWHVYHDPKWEVPIWKSRGYLNAQDFTECLLEKINNTVGETDYIWFLGDMFLNATDEQCLNWLSRINCKNIYKLWGNHCSNTYRLYKQEVLNQFGRNDIEVYPLKMGNVTFVGNHLEIQVGKQRLVLNHFPLRIWNGCHRFSWHLSGHSHLNDPLRRPEYPLAKALDTGIDYGKIWSFEEIQELMSTKTVELIDHHDKGTN